MQHAFPLEIKHTCKIQLPGDPRLRSRGTRSECLPKSKTVLEAVTIASQIKQIGFQVLPKVIENEKCVVQGSLFYLQLALDLLRGTVSMEMNLALGDRGCRLSKLRTCASQKWHRGGIRVTWCKCQGRKTCSPSEGAARTFQNSTFQKNFKGHCFLR